MADLTLMLIFAHPDDESFAGAGAVIRYTRDGVRAALVSATLGERGKPGDPPLCTPEELPRMREQELRCAAQALGISELRLLGYKDKELPDTPEAEAVGKLVACIREVKPQVIFTFPPDGHSGHLDHLAVNRWVSTAYRAAGNADAYPEAGAPWQPARLFWHLRPAGAGPESVDAVIKTPDVIEQRIAALQCHRTQHLSIERVFQNFDRTLLEDWWQKDHFHLADTVLPRPTHVLDDLFAGLR